MRIITITRFNHEELGLETEVQNKIPILVGKFQESYSLLKCSEGEQMQTLIYK